MVVLKPSEFKRATTSNHKKLVQWKDNRFLQRKAARGASTCLPGLTYTLSPALRGLAGHPLLVMVKEGGKAVTALGGPSGQLPSTMNWEATPYD